MKKYKLTFDETRIILMSLIELRNKLIEEDHLRGFKIAKLLNISDLQLSYITNVDAGHGLIKVGSSLVPFANKFPKNTKLYKLMTTRFGESA